MAVETLLHSGSFTNYGGDDIIVTFHKRYDINAYPTSINMPSLGGTTLLAVWSRKGEAEIGDNFPDWMSWSHYKAEDIPGTEYHKYTYRITCSANNTGSERSFNISVGIEYGEGIGQRLLVPLHQDA